MGPLSMRSVVLLAAAFAVAGCTADSAGRAGRRVYQGAAEREGSGAAPEDPAAAAAAPAGEPLAPGDEVDRSGLGGLPIGSPSVAAREGKPGQSDDASRRSRRKVDEEAEETGQFFAEKLAAARESIDRGDLAVATQVIESALELKP